MGSWSTRRDVESFKAVTGPIYMKIGEVAGPDFVEKVMASMN